MAQIPVFGDFTQNEQTLHIHRRDSRREEMLSAVSKFLIGQQLVLLFVDEYISYCCVRADFEMYSPLVRRGEIAAFHDIAVQPSPNEVVRPWHTVFLGAVKNLFVPIAGLISESGRMALTRDIGSL
jgi:hypothetical protein